MTPFVEHRIDGAKFFGVKSEGEMGRVWGVKKIGTRKNLMRYVRKLQLLERKIEEKRRREMEAEQASMEERDHKEREDTGEDAELRGTFIEKSGRQDTAAALDLREFGRDGNGGDSPGTGRQRPGNGYHIDTDDLGIAASAGQLPTSKSEENAAAGGGGVFKWAANISNVHGVVTGAMFGLSGWWTNAAAAKGRKGDETAAGQDPEAGLPEGAALPPGRGEPLLAAGYLPTDGKDHEAMQEGVLEGKKEKEVKKESHEDLDEFLDFEQNPLDKEQDVHDQQQNAVGTESSGLNSMAVDPDKFPRAGGETEAAAPTRSREHD